MCSGNIDGRVPGQSIITAIKDPIENGNGRRGISDRGHGAIKGCITTGDGGRGRVHDICRAVGFNGCRINRNEVIDHVAGCGTDCEDDISGRNGRSGSVGGNISSSRVK